MGVATRTLTRRPQARRGGADLGIAGRCARGYSSATAAFGDVKVETVGPPTTFREKMETRGENYPKFVILRFPLAALHPEIIVLRSKQRFMNIAILNNLKPIHVPEVPSVRPPLWA